MLACGGPNDLDAYIVGVPFGNINLLNQVYFCIRKKKKEKFIYILYFPPLQASRVEVCMHEWDSGIGEQQKVRYNSKSLWGL